MLGRRRPTVGAAVDHPPYYTDTGDVCISPRQLEIHRTTEFVSFVLGVPLMAWIAYVGRHRKLRPVEVTGLLVLAGGALVVDTMLWRRFHWAEKARSG